MKIIDMPLSKKDILLRLEAGKAIEVKDSDVKTYRSICTQLNRDNPDRKYSLKKLTGGGYAAGRRK